MIPVARILLAEDNPADVYLLKEALSVGGHAGVELIVVTDGEQALDFVSRQDAPNGNVDLIVLDLNLPKSDGSDVLRSIRDDSRFASVPVVILTSSDSPRDRAVAEKLGANSYLTKPSDLDDFLALGAKLMAYVGRDGRVAKAGRCC